MNRMLLREARNESKRLKYEFPEYKVNGQVCQYYSYYSCITCEKHVYDKLDRIFCDGCHLWTHRWCARVSKLEYVCLKILLKHGTVNTARKTCSLFFI